MFGLPLEELFTLLIAVQFMAIASHDLLDIPGLSHGRQIRAALGARKLWLVTAVNSIFPGVALGLGLAFWGHAHPLLVRGYWLLYCAITVLSAIAMWYLPYFFGANAKTKAEYNAFYAGTFQVLPPRGDNPRPNLLHIAFHVLFVITLVLSVLIVRR